MNIGSLVAKLKLNTTEFNSSLAQAQGSMKRAGSSMKSFGSSTTKYVTAPLGIAAAASFKMAKDFEASLSKVSGLVGVAGDQVEAWGDDIIKMAPKLGKAPRELADGLFFVTSAGIKGAAAMRTLEISARASAAGLGETETVADLITSAMNAYGQENLNAAAAADTLVAAVREGKAEAPALASSMGQVLPVAAEMGVSFDQVGASMAAMTRSGTSASEASTQLRSILTGILKPSQQSEAALKKMNTSFSEVRKTIREKGMFAALSDLKNLTNKYGEDAMAKVFPNVRALSGVLDMMGKNAEANSEIFDSLSDSTGSLDKAFEEASKTTEFQYNQAVQGVKTSLVALGMEVKEAVIPLLQKLSSIAQKVTNWFTNLTDSQKQLVVKLGAVAAAVGPVALVLGTLAGSVLPRLISVGGGAIKMFRTLGAVMKANPIGAIIALVAALVAIIRKAWQESAKFRAVVKTVVAKVGGFFKKLGISIKYQAIMMWENVKAKFKAIGQAGKVLWDTLKAVFQKGKSPREVFKEGFAKIGSDMAEAGSEARKKMEEELAKVQTPDYKEILAKEQAAQAAKEAGKEMKKNIEQNLGTKSGEETGKKFADGFKRGMAGATSGAGSGMAALTAMEAPELKGGISLGTEDAKAELANMEGFFTRNQERAKEYFANMKAENRESWMEMGRQASQTLSSISQVMGGVSDLYRAQKENELALAEKTAKEEGKSEEWLAKKKADINKKYAKKEKNMAIAMALINTALGVTKALTGSPPPLNFIMAALVAAAGAVQISTIKSQPMADGGVVPPGFPNDTYPARLTSGETVVPPGKLPSVSEGGNQTLTTRVSGQDIEIVYERWKRTKETVK